MREVSVPTYDQCNGETTPPQVTDEDTWTYYWFDGEAVYEDGHGRKGLFVKTGEGTETLQGLVAVFMFDDPLRKRRYPAVVNVSNPEHIPFALSKCTGRFWGPVYVPEMPPR